MIGLLFSGDAESGCPQTANYYPNEDFSCQEKIYNALLNQASLSLWNTQHYYIY